ncbi:hypothetical protein ACTA71_010662 [Dictyostelium dimigraforme]
MESLSLKFIEPYWFKFVDYYGEDFLITYGTFIAHEVFYFGSFIPFFLCDFMPFLQKYKIQPTKKNEWSTQFNCIFKVLMTHIFVQLPMMYIFDPAIKAIGLSARAPLPSIPYLIFTIACCFLIEDFYFYWVHRALHHGIWYKHIHKIHHDHAAPFGMTAEYAHPLETVILGVGTVIGPFIFSRDLFTLWVWLGTRLFQTVECHSGYDFPWNPTKLIPFWGGSHFHDFHHETFVGNYSSTFTYLDKIFGTSDKYYSRKQIKEAKLAAGKSE